MILIFPGLVGRIVTEDWSIEELSNTTMRISYRLPSKGINEPFYNSVVLNITMADLIRFLKTAYLTRVCDLSLVSKA